MAIALPWVEHSAAAAERGRAAGMLDAPPRPSVDRIGSWRLVSLVGEGSWTRVYRAAPARLSEGSPADYAVKVLRPELQHDPIAGRLLQREELVGRQVTHPHLAPVLSSRIDRKPYFIASPFLLGWTLRECLTGERAIEVKSEPVGGQGASESPQQRPLAVSSALWVARQVAEALDALHTAGWLHGDVKPSNIHVASSGHTTLLDLGFARRLGPHLDAHAVPWDSLLVGCTPAYAAPEIHQSQPNTDPASDLYSLGVVLFEMLTGRWPFAHHDMRKLAAAHCHDPIPDPRQWASHVPARVVRLLHSLLAKSPDERPLTAELIDKLVDLEIATFGE